MRLGRNGMHDSNIPFRDCLFRIKAKNPPEKWLIETSSHRSCTEQIMSGSESRSGVPFKLKKRQKTISIVIPLKLNIMRLVYNSKGKITKTSLTLIYLLFVI